MGRVISGITTSLDGYITGPHDGPGQGLGEGGERLHHWVFGGPWSYAEGAQGEATGVDKEYLEAANANVGAVIGGRATYEAADHWGGHNPWPVPFFIVTHRPAEEPREGGFTFVDGLDAAMRRAQAVAEEKDIAVMGGADLIRQALRAGYVDEFTLTIAPVILGAGKSLFEGFDADLHLEHVGVRQSPLAIHITYLVRRPAP